MKKLVSVLLALVLVLAATSALALSNISEISGLPDLPELPKMKVKSVGSNTTVSLDSPVSWLAVVRNWEYTNLEFDENNVATYSTSGQKVAAGFGLWGWANSSWSSANDYGFFDYVENVDLDKLELYSDYYEKVKKQKVNGKYQLDGGEHVYVNDVLVKHKPGYRAYLPKVVTGGYAIDEEAENPWLIRVKGKLVPDESPVWAPYSLAKDEYYLDVEPVYIDSDEDDREVVQKLIDAKAKEIAKSGVFTEDDVLSWAADNWLAYWGDYYDEEYYTLSEVEKHVQGGAYDAKIAYDGETADGIRVQYDSHGHLIGVVMNVTGQNFFGSETAPVKSTITWAPGNYVYYISNITEEYEDGAKVSVDFAHNGKVLRVR